MSWSFTDDQIRAAFPMAPWDHQFRSVKGTCEMLSRVDSMTLCLPTGAGKTNCAAALLNLSKQSGLNGLVLSNRKMLTEQLSDSLIKFGIDHGVRAASLPGRMDFGAGIQISSIQTELARADSWERHKADILLVDESHQYNGFQYMKFIQEYIAAGTKVVLLTGTPINMSHITPNLLVGATNSELRACGAHVPAIIKALNEFDTSKVVRKKVAVGDPGDGEFTEESAKEWFYQHRQQIVGTVYNDWVRFNPLGKMTLGVAPGSEEAITMAQEFWKHGTTAAAITAKGIWANGKSYNDDVGGKTRKMIDDDWQSGDIKVMWNRYVYREAIDRPGLFHLVIATPIGSLKSWLQTCGRVIRKSPQTPDYVLITDHGGSWYEHDSPNLDRNWHELYHMSEGDIRKEQKKKNKEAADKGEDAICCPKCGTVLRKGKCPPAPMGCGEPLAVTNPNRMRRVIQADGKLIEVENITRLGSEPKERKKSTKTQEQIRWDKLFWAARRSNSNRPMNFNQLVGLYKKTHHQAPPMDLMNMPLDPRDFERKVRVIPTDSLRTPHTIAKQQSEPRSQDGSQ